VSPPSPANATILVANDHEWTARSLETILSAEGFVVVRAFTAAQALDRAAASRPDAFVLDVQLPDLDGMQLCSKLRADPLIGKSVPIVLTTAGPAGRQERLAAYRAGAWEFFGQPLDGEALLLKLGVYLDAKRVVDEWRAQSLIDETTGLYSRRGLLQRGRELAADAARRGRAIACLVFRPDLPELASTLTSAEAVVKKVGELLRANGRTADALGRVGPLEFGIVAAGLESGDVQHLVRRLNQAGASVSTAEDDGRPGLAFKMAVCAMDPDQARSVDLDEVIGRATTVLADSQVDLVGVSTSA